MQTIGFNTRTVNFFLSAISLDRTSRDLKRLPLLKVTLRYKSNDNDNIMFGVSEQRLRVLFCSSFLERVGHVS